MINEIIYKAELEIRRLESGGLVNGTLLGLVEPMSVSGVGDCYRTGSGSDWILAFNDSPLEF